jgi:hypothetical protein
LAGTGSLEIGNCVTVNHKYTTLSSQVIYSDNNISITADRLFFPNIIYGIQDENDNDKFLIQLHHPANVQVVK